MRKKLRVQKFMKKCLLNSAETSPALSITNLGIQVIEDEAVESEESRIQTKVVNIDMKTLVKTFLCPECDSQVEIKNANGCCKHSESVASKRLCNEKASVKMVVIT